MPPSTPPSRSRAARLALRIALGLGAAVLLLALVWAGAQVAQRRPRPQPLWTEADLPALPPSEDNGWALVARELPQLGGPPTVPSGWRR